MTDNQDAVAIIGLGCRFPDDAEDPQAFWDMLICLLQVWQKPR